MIDQHADYADLGVILAGGLSRRMEGPEKSLMLFSGKPMIERTCIRLAKQVGEIIINANGDAKRFEFLGKPVQPDTVEGFAGPLAGVLAGMTWASKNKPDCERIISVPADTPFFPEDLANRFSKAVTGLSPEERNKAICLAYSDGNRHPVFGSWPVAVMADLHKFLVEENERKVMLFVQRYNLLKIDFPLLVHEGQPFDPFFNINTQTDMALGERMFKAVNHA